MIFLRLLLLAFAAAFCWLTVTQVILPLWRGERLFWLFRKDSGHKRISDLTVKVNEETLQRQADKLELGSLNPNQTKTEKK